MTLDQLCDALGEIDLQSIDLEIEHTEERLGKLRCLRAVREIIVRKVVDAPTVVDEARGESHNETEKPKRRRRIVVNEAMERRHELIARLMADSGGSCYYKDAAKNIGEEPAVVYQFMHFHRDRYERLGGGRFAIIGRNGMAQV